MSLSHKSQKSSSIPIPIPMTVKIPSSSSSSSSSFLWISRIFYFYAFLMSSLPVAASDGLEADGPCRFIFQESEGSISLPQNPLRSLSEVNCMLDISKTKGNQCGVQLTFDRFNLESPDTDGFCKEDWIAVDSCVPEGGARFCGNITRKTYEYPFQKDAAAFRLVFHSNNYTADKDFRIYYKLLTDCKRQENLFWNPPYNVIPDVFPPDTPCFTQVTERKGTINTPWFPENYPDNMDCVYEFIRDSPFMCGIRMRALSFELDSAIDTEYGGACLDFFHISGCGFLCGKLRFLWTAKFQPGATSLKFHFHSDESKSRGGFQIAFEQVYNCS